MAEGKQHRHLFFVIVAVADKNPLCIGNDPVLTGEIEIRGIVLQTNRPGFSQMAAGIDRSVQQIHRRCAHLFPAEIHTKDGGYILQPRQLHRCAAVQNHRRIRVDSRHRRNQPVLILRQPQVLPVRAFGLKCVGQTREDHAGIHIPGNFQRLSKKRIVRRFISGIEPSGIPDRSAGGLRRSHGMGNIDMAGARPLVARCLGKFPEKGNRMLPVQRQHAFIFQQNGTFTRKTACKRPAGGPVNDRIRIPLLQALLYETENPKHSPVQIGLSQTAASYCPYQRLAGGIGAAGHLQIQTCGNASGAVLDRTPIGNHKPVEAPPVSENIGQQHPVFSAVFPVDGIVGTHETPDTSLFYHSLECRQINLMKGSLVHLRRTGHTPRLLVIAGEMLGAGGHSPGL